ncbi:13815_t:CDS:2 [Gigaspora margarita]|uniref:13815_t:CDS:1 n=1 Tax=Gigaspora margarita TaxID=4874 RepID=A0ABM8VX58_GIGMA|nr:13815_t:CDS:2 [Gigaspora margarita]
MFAIFSCDEMTLYVLPTLCSNARSFILGHYSLLNDKFDKNLIQLAKQYDGIFRLHLMLNEPHLIITDPQLVQKILTSYDFQGVANLRAISYDLFGSGLVCAQGNNHKRQRKLMNPLFTFANVKEMIPTFIQGGHQLKDHWINLIGDKKEERISITSLISQVTLDIIGLIGFNYEFNSLKVKSELAKAYEIMNSYNTSPLFGVLIDFFPFVRKLPFDYNIRYNNSLKIASKISENLVIEHKNNPIKGKDLLSLLVETNEVTPDHEKLTHDELVSQAFPDQNHQPTLDEIDQLKYLECIFKETVRIIPPSQVIHRITTKDEVLNDYIVPKGTRLQISINSIHHDPLIWGENVEEFVPSRWLDSELKITNYKFLPFGAGYKLCIGWRVASLEFKSLLIVLIRNLKFNVVEEFAFKKKPIGMARPVPGIDLWISKFE